MAATEVVRRERSDMIISQIIGGELTLRKDQIPNFTVGKLWPRGGRDVSSVIQWPCDCSSHPKLWEEEFGGIEGKVGGVRDWERSFWEIIVCLARINDSFILSLWTWSGVP